MNIRRLARNALVACVIVVVILFVVSQFVSVPEDTPDAVAGPSPAQATKEHLASIPKYQREQIAREEQWEILSGSGTSMVYFMDQSIDDCLEWWGTDLCHPWIFELSPNGPCGWELVRHVPWKQGQTLENGPAYFGYLGDSEAQYFGYELARGDTDLTRIEILQCILDGISPRIS